MSFFWDFLYLFREIPWDTGITPPEIVEMVESGRLRPAGHVLDLGCGTGTNAIYLAQRDFDVTAIDISRVAIARARRKARSLVARTRTASQSVHVRFERGDVSRMDHLVTANSIDFAYDIGCFHTLAGGVRMRYVHALASVLHPRAIYMLYAFTACQPGASGLAEGEVEWRFGQDFEVESVQHGADRGERKSAWYTLVKHAAQ